MAVHEQFSFGGGLNAVRAEDKLAETEVAAAVNIDFGLEEGAAAVRRGSHKRWHIGAPIRRIFRNFNDPTQYGDAPYYIAAADGIWRHKSGNLVKIVDGGAEKPAFGAWREWTLIANGSQYWADNGQTTREWVGQAPTSPPAVELEALAPLNLAAGGWTVVQGTLVSDSDGVITVDSVDQRVVLDIVNVPQGRNLSVNGPHPIGSAGVHYLDIQLSNPDAVSLITQDYSVDSDTFEFGAWHAELRPGDSESTAAWAEAVVESLPDADASTRDAAIEDLRRNLQAPRTMFPSTPNTWHVWAVARPQFQSTARKSASLGWADIGRIRITVQGVDNFTVKLRNFTVAGAETYPLYDPVVGYTWWETWAEVVDGVVIRESAPSPPSQTVRASGVRAAITLSGAPSGNAHGYTHRCLYRQGGLMRDAHRIATVPLSAAEVTDGLSDIRAVFEPVMERDIHSRATIPGNIVAISEPFMGRIFVATANRVMWSEPGRPDVFRKDSWTMVSHSGDEVQGLVVWGNSLVIVNRDSIYELTGTDFSADGDWRLYRSPCRHGTLFRDFVFRTPVGIPLFNNDGLTFYNPGSGGEQRLPWVEAKIGPVWDRLASTTRLVRHQPGQGVHPWAVWTSHRLYFAIEPSNTVYVLDFLRETAFYYVYPFTTACGFYDPENYLLAGTAAGSVMELEAAQPFDRDDQFQQVPIEASLRTRTWTWAAPSRLMNISVDCRGTVGVRAVEGGGTEIVVADVSAAVRHRTTPTMAGAGGDAVRFEVSLQGDSAIYGLEWDRYEEPLTTLYVRTQYFVPDTEMHYQLARLTVDTFGQPVSVRLFVDGQQVLEREVATAGQGPATVPISLSARGWTAFAILQAETPFRYYPHLEWTGEPEPPRVTEWTTELEDFGGEVELKTLEATLDCLGGTVNAELKLDAQTVSTYQFTGAGVKGYAQAAPLVPYGGAFNHPFCRTAQVRYWSDTPFKHYKTWYGVVREPSRVRHWRSETQWWADDQEVQAVEWAAEGFGQTITFRVFIDSQLVHTFTKTAQGHVGGTETIPSTIVGRSAHVIAEAPAPFKPYGVTWRTRQLPPRVNRWRTETQWWADDQEIQAVEWEVQGPAQTLQFTVYVDDAAVHSFQADIQGHTSRTEALPSTVVGRNAYVLIESPGGLFRPFGVKWRNRELPPRVTRWRTEDRRWVSPTRLRTVACSIDPRGTPVTAQVYVGGQLVRTAVFTGSGIRTEQIGLDLDVAEGTTAYVLYTAAAPFRHFETEWHDEPQPFEKVNWGYRFTRPVGTAQMLRAVRWGLRVYAPQPATLVLRWNDGQDEVHMATVYAPGGRLAEMWAWFPPGVRFSEMSVNIDSGGVPVRVAGVDLDVEITGMRGVFRVTLEGVPNAR